MSETAQPTAATPPVTPTAQPPAQPQPIEVKTTTGQVYRGNTYEEVVQQLVTAQENASRRIHELSQQVPQVQPKPADQYDPAKYYEIFAQDPLKAQQYLDSFNPNVQRAMKVAEQVEDYAISNAFQQACPDFPQGDPRAADAVVEMAGKIMAAYNTDKLTVPVMVMAHHECVKQNIYPAVTPQIVSNPTPTPGTPPPPPPSSTSGSEQPVDPWAMTTEKLKEYINSQQGRQ